MNILKSKNLEKSALKVSNSLLEKKKKISDDRINMLLESLHYKTELDNNQLKLKKAKSRELMTFIISGSGMILLGFIIINYRNRRKAAMREALIHQQKKQLAENKLKTKEAELMQMSTFIIEKNELLNTINADLKYHQNLLNNNADKKRDEARDYGKRTGACGRSLKLRGMRSSNFSFDGIDLSMKWGE